jgi:hypothetical protein
MSDPVENDLVPEPAASSAVVAEETANFVWDDSAALSEDDFNYETWMETFKIKRNGLFADIWNHIATFPKLKTRKGLGSCRNALLQILEKENLPLRENLPPISELAHPETIRQPY